MLLDNGVGSRILTILRISSLEVIPNTAALTLTLTLSIPHTSLDLIVALMYPHYHP